MNVLQAMEKLDKLNDRVNALTVAAEQLEFRNDYNHEARLLKEIKSEVEKEVSELKSRLEKTVLIPVRGLDDSNSANNNPFY